jgi:hypothetical protein
MQHVGRSQGVDTIAIDALEFPAAVLGKQEAHRFAAL